MLESHTTQFGFHWGCGARIDEYARLMFVHYPGVPLWWPASALWQWFYRRDFMPRFHGMGVSRHTEEQRRDISCRDLEMLEKASMAGQDKVCKCLLTRPISLA